MYQARPHGKHSPSVERSEEDQAAAELLVRRLTNIKDSSGVDSLRMVRSLPSGAIAIAQDAGGVLRLIIQDPVKPPQEPDFDGIAKEAIPMLFSGVIDSGTSRTGDGIKLRITEQSRRRLASYKTKGLPPASLQLKRFLIRYNSRVQELQPKSMGSVIYTQYTAQRPTWYSGAMSEVMQIVGGYGIQNVEELPDDPIERAVMTLPEKVMRKIRLEQVNLRLPGYTGSPPRSGEFQYDYKFSDTNGVGFDSDGKPWLLKVDVRGVFAMPLPLVPATTTNAFREYIEEVGDEEILWILDRFGGMPTGENFPVRVEDFESWRRAGVIIKICDSAGFYDNYMYSSACGWSFNSQGNAGYNTCYNYDEKEGLGYGLAYSLSISLGAAENAGKLPSTFDFDGSEMARKLDAYLSALYSQLGDGKAKSLAIKYKVRRVPISKIIERFGNDGAGEVDYWDNLEVDPIAIHTGNVKQSGKGWLYSGLKFLSQPQIKFPEPFLDGCVSHDFSPLQNGKGKSSYPTSDTIMYGYFTGDQLSVVKYFRDDRRYNAEVSGNYEDCMAVGAWSSTETYGESTLLGNFYTSEVDHRKAAAAVTTVTDIVGTDLGYDTQPHFSFDNYFEMSGSIWRNRYFKRVTNTERTEGYGMSVAVCVPYFHRGALLYARKEWYSGKKRTESLSVGAVRDPNSYRYYTYDFIFAWRGGPDGGNMATAIKVDPAPKDGNPVWVTGYNYNPSLCSDFADAGDWVGGLPADYTWLIHPDRYAWHHSGGGGMPTIKQYSKSSTEPAKEYGETMITIYGSLKNVNKNPSYGYFTASPDEFGNVFYVDAIALSAGNSQYSSSSETNPESAKSRIRWGHTALADHKSAHHFIGVINE